MCMIIDAHVMREFYLEVTQGQSSATEAVTPIIDTLSHENPAYLDENGMIKHKWRTNVKNEWFSGWFPRALAADKIRFIEPLNPSTVRNRLASDCGFPIQSRKIWYIRTGEAVANEEGACVLLSEDLHFYEPGEKNCGSDRKERILRNRVGCVVEILDDVDVSVHCVATCC